MSTSQDRTVIWIVAAVILALVCCLCLVLVATGAAIYVSTTSVTPQPPLPLPSPNAQPTPEAPPSSWTPQEVPPQALEVEDELRSEVVPV
ncbi:MAG TPA: hypothetical protein VK449_02340, partial [Anaerolineales bacterium]|nr:hypothetical protein [Anaerolineales bacterium]